MTEHNQEKKSFWREGISLLVLALITGGIWLFVEIADEVVEGDTHHLDSVILLSMRDPADTRDPWGPEWLEEMGRDFTALGGMGILFLLIAGTAGGYLLKKQHKTALLIVAAVFGGLVISLILKQGFDRPRPDLVPHGSYVYTKSFPSGHSMLSAITYLTLGSLMVRTVKNRSLKIYIMALSILITLLVGLSRVYLGVHWPTDVLAGWTAGASWALICWFVAARASIHMRNSKS
ncbi:MAG: phosphatase PAP2 family protein [Sedimentisphaerales bacterium]|nr:phosphatase PAP2 family protein [Sedimentisphaerales bacterium]